MLDRKGFEELYELTVRNKKKGLPGYQFRYCVKECQFIDVEEIKGKCFECQHAIWNGGVCDPF